MILNLGSLAFNVPVRTGGNTPSWGTEMGQGFDYKFSFEGMGNLFTAFAYNSIDNCRQRVFCPLGKGGNRQNDFEYVIAGLFKKVFVNDIFVPNAKFVMLVVKQINGEHHNGRRSLKYNPKITLDNQSVNYDCLNKVQNALGIKPEAAWFIHEIDFKNQDELHFTAYVLNGQKSIEFINAENRKRAFINAIDTGKHYRFDKQGVDDIDFSHRYNIQQIYYGAPGTGKSHIINVHTAGESVVRTTFHPDSDYSTFVGAYKPTTKKVRLRDMAGHVIKEDGKEVSEERITYEFVPQAFLQAYIKAWSFYADTAFGETPQRQFLIVEEINRGNCAQIFGDLFQLLDRNDKGFSDYPIIADNDMRKQLAKAFENLQIPQAEQINALYKEANITSKILSGEILLLPNNLFIWATMNTSDQSLFPIDSAFKRRWDWQYMPIDQGKDRYGVQLNWVIQVGNHEYDWWEFITIINEKISEALESEDKKLGFFFCKAEKGVISADRFVGKVLFYLWNDVFKDLAHEDEGIFRGITFNSFYKVDNGNVKVCTEEVDSFLLHLGLHYYEQASNSEIYEETIDKSFEIRVNNIKIKFVNAVPYTTIQEYIRLNPQQTVSEILNTWMPFKKQSLRKWIVADEDYITQLDKKEAEYSVKLECGDGNPIWVNKDGWTHHPKNPAIRDSVQDFIEAVNKAHLGITIVEEPTSHQQKEV